MLQIDYCDGAVQKDRDIRRLIVLVAISFGSVILSSVWSSAGIALAYHIEKISRTYSLLSTPHGWLYDRLFYFLPVGFAGVVLGCLAILTLVRVVQRRWQTRWIFMLGAYLFAWFLLGVLMLGVADDALP